MNQKRFSCSRDPDNLLLHSEYVKDKLWEMHRPKFMELISENECVCLLVQIQIQNLDQADLNGVL